MLGFTGSSSFRERVGRPVLCVRAGSSEHQSVGVTPKASGVGCCGRGCMGWRSATHSIRQGWSPSETFPNIALKISLGSSPFSGDLFERFWLDESSSHTFGTRGFILCGIS